MIGIDLIFDLAIVAAIAGVAGLVCRALNLSVVVGYLLAGILIGPYSPPFQLVSDTHRIQMLADLGLIFLIFGIGLSFSIRRMKRLGGSLVMTAGLGALLVLLFCRTAASAVGFTNQQGLFIAAVLMVSSSAVIAKVLEEERSNHTRWGQLALGVTLLEDIVAIVMLTLLSGMVHVGGKPDESMWKVISSFSGFVVLFFVIILLFVPRLLRWLQYRGVTELSMLLVAGLLLGFGWLSDYLGYSMALTAFMFGAVIGSTPQRAEVERLFEGIRHLFGAVFFVAMGMMFNVGLFGEFWPAMLALAAAAIVFRPIALAIALMLTGNSTQSSVKASVTLTPMGEFSFVIAFLGIESGVMPEGFYPAAVGASILTCLVSPVLIRRAETIGEKVENRIPAALLSWATSYRDWLDELNSARSRSFAWSLIAPRIAQVLAYLLLAGGVLAISSPVYNFLIEAVGPDVLFPRGTIVLLFIGTGILLLPLIVATWRNISALSMIIAEATTPGGGRARQARPVIQRAIASASLVFAALWLLALLPADLLPLPVLGGVLGILCLITLLLWKKLIIWHSKLEITIQGELTVASMPSTDGERKWVVPELTEKKEWSLRVEEFLLPPDTSHAGKEIADLNLRGDWGCSILGIDRQGYAINNPKWRDRIFPGDKLLLLGTSEALVNAAGFLSRRASEAKWLDQFQNLATENILVPTSCSFHGKTLEELNLVNRFGVQIAGIRRMGQGEIVSPGAQETVLSGDSLLVVGAHDSIRAFSSELEEGAQ